MHETYVITVEMHYVINLESRPRNKRKKKKHLTFLLEENLRIMKHM